MNSPLPSPLPLPHSCARLWWLLALTCCLQAPSMSADNPWNLAGAGNWDVSTANWAAPALWANGNNDTAVFGGTGAVITLTTGITAGGLTFNTTGYTIAGGANVLTLGAATNTITLGAGTTSTISAILGGTTGATITGAGTLALSGVNTLTGGFTVAGGGTLSFTADSTLGGASNGITLNNGTLLMSALGTPSFSAGRTLNFAAGGGTVNILATAGSPATGKIVTTAANQLTGAGNLVKSGNGDFQLAFANSTLTSNWTINAGVVEAQNTSALGSGNVTVNTGGELVTSNVSIGNSITLAGGTLSANGALLAGNFTGTVNVTGASTIAARLFQAPASTNTVTLSGPLTGAGNLTFTSGATLVAASPGMTILSGSMSGYTGNFTIANSATLSLRTPNLASPTLGTAGANATYYNFQANIGTAGVGFSQALLYQNPQAFSRTDSTVAIPIAGANGYYPVVPVLGFGMAGAGGINDAVMWKGLLNITTAGNYQFSGQNDDAAILYIDGAAIGTLGVIATNTPIGSAVTLGAGPHSLVYKTTQGSGGGYSVLNYTGADTASATVTVGSVVGSLTTGALTATAIPGLNVTGLVATPSTLDLTVDATAPTLSFAAGTQLTATSPTVSNLTITGATMLSGAATLANPGAGVIFNGAIGETVSSALTISGGYRTTMNATNTYTGLTSVTAGELDLNAPSNAIPAGLAINAANANGLVTNVKLLQSNQIADGATVTLTSGVLDLGANNDTVGTLVLNGGILSSTTGVLTAGTYNLQTGLLNGIIASGTGLTKSTAGTLVIGKDQIYTGVTNISVGALNARTNNALGATGAGNGTTVASGGALQVQGNITLAEDVTINGTGGAADGALRNTGGANTISTNVVAASASTIQSDAGTLTLGGLTGSNVNVTIQGAGDVALNSAWSLGSGTLTKTGTGALVFNSPQTALPSMTWSGGVLGFSGTQNLGAVTLGSTAPVAATTWRFLSDPGAGTQPTVAAGTTLIAGFAVNQSFLNTLGTASAGTLALGANSGNNLSLASYASLGLGGSGVVNYTGALTPAGTAYKFSAAAQTSLAPNVLNLNTSLTGANAVNVTGGTVNLIGSSGSSAAVNLYSGGVNITGGTVRALNDPNLGTAGSVVTLNGGTLQYAVANASSVAVQFVRQGTGLSTAGRTINLGAGDGTLDVTSQSIHGAGLALTQANSITGAASTTLTKTGEGQLLILNALDGTTTGFAGTLNIGANSGFVNILAGGYVRGLKAVNVNSGSIFQVDNNTNMGQPRQFVFNPTVNGTDGDKIGNTIAINLQGGTLQVQGRNVAFGVGTGNYEKLGTVNLTNGQNIVNAVSAGLGGGEIAITTLARPVGGGTVRFNSSVATLGTAGSAGRIVLTNVDTTGTPAAVTVGGLLGGWATINGVDFVSHVAQSAAGAAGGIVAYGSTVVGVTPPAYTLPVTGGTPAAALFTTGTVGNAAAVSTVLGAAGAGQNWTIGALKMSNAAASTLTFAGTTGTADTIYLESGGLLTDGLAFTRTIGATTSAFTRGRLTAGLTTATTAQELFLHNNSASALVIHSVILDNPNNAAATVKVVKDLDGLVQLSGTNTYTGGTSVLKGTLEAQSASSLGAGAVNVRNARLSLNVAGTTTSTTGINVSDQGEILLNSTTGIFTSTGDRFNVAAGSILIGPAASNAGQGLNSLTRVASLSAGGQIVLATDAIVSHQNFPNSDQVGIGNNTIKSLGTNADLYYGLSGTNASALSSLTVGSGTAWKGISTDRTARAWQQGTIVANSDFWLQGSINNGTNVALTLGGDGVAGTYNIVNNASKAITAFVTGQVSLTEDSVLTMPSNLTFVVTPGALLQPNRTNSFGSGANVASVIVQAGATMDPGNYVAIGSAANQDTAIYQNLPYPIPSPLNGNVSVEAGGRLVINDASGIGSSSAVSTIRTNGILDLGTANAFYGRGNYALNLANPVDTTGTINAGQFAYEAGAVVRVSADNVYKLSSFVAGETNGEKVVYELYNAGRTLTNQTNPFLKPVLGTPTIAPENIRIANGGMITNDEADRTLGQGRGKIILGDGAILAGTTQTFMNMTDNVEVEAGATISIGTPRWVEGMPKLGGVNFTGANSNVMPANSTMVVQDGATLVFGAVNVFSDNASLQLPTAVTNFAMTGAAGNQPGNGSTLLLNVTNTAEIAGSVTGNGAVIAGAAGEFLGLGNGVADYKTGIVFKSANAQQANLYKVGTSKVTMTGVSDATGVQLVGAGELIYSGTGRAAYADNRVAKSGKLTLDNSGTALSDRLGGSTKNLSAMGGTVEIIGHATTPVTENINNLANSAASTGPFTGAAGYSVLKITPGAAKTSLNVTAFENFQSAGTGLQRSATWVLTAPSLGNTPGTYASTGIYTINPSNTTNGLIQVQTPNFGSQGAFGIGAAAIAGQSGSSVAPTLPGVLGDATGAGATGFVTEDTVSFAGLTTVNLATTITLPAGGGAKVRVGMPLNGPGVAAATFATAIAGDLVTLNNAIGTGAVGNVNFIDSMRLLASSEYAATPLSTANTNLNVKLSSATATVVGDSRVATLSFAGNSTLNINGTLPLASTPSRFHLNSAGVFVQAGATATINGAGPTNFFQANGGASMYLHTQGTLNLNATAYTDNAIVKTGTGTLNVGAGAFGVFRGSVQIDDGIVNLGSNNSFSSIRQLGTFTTSENLYLNGGTLNLNGNSQMVNSLTNNNLLPGNGGTVTSSSPAILTVQGAGQFSGSIGGSISLDKVNNNTLLLTSASGYSGNTAIRAGTLQLRDLGALTNTSSVDLYSGAALTLDNSYLSNVANRIPATTPINSKGGTINLVGAAGQAVSQTFNNVNLLAGRLDFGNTSGGGGSINVSMDNLTRAAGTGSTLTVNTTFGFLGTAGSTTDAFHYMINNTTLNGGATTALTLNDGLVGGWAVANGSDFLTYSATTGLGALGNTGDGYAAYGSTDVTTATATQNVNDGTARTLATSKTINSWRMAPGAAIVNTYNQGVQLTVDTGGLLSNAAQTISHNPALNSTGQSITSNSGELDYWVNQNTNGVNIPIVGSIDLVKSGAGTLNLNPSLLYNNGASNTVNGTTTATLTSTTGLALGMPVSGTGITGGTTITGISPTTITLSQTATATGANTLSFPQSNGYTGKTFVNSGVLTGNLPSADGVNYVSVPGDLVIASARYENLLANNLKKTANVLITGSGRLDLTAADNTTETINSVTFADASGAGTTMNLDRQTQRLTSTLNLAAAVPVTVNNTNPNTVPLVGGFLGNLGFTPASGTSTLLVNAPTPTGINSGGGLNAMGLRISAAISTVPSVAEGGLVKSGTGILGLGPDQTVANAVNTLTVGSNLITTSTTTGLAVGMPLTGTGLPVGSIITAIVPNTSITVSQNITTAGTNVALTAGMFNFNQTALTYDGTTGSLVDALNISQGVVRADNNQALGTNSANTTVQNGGVLLANGTTALLGSIKLKSGSTLGVTIASATLGVASNVVTNQSVLNVPSGDVTISATDYFLQGTNAGNLVVNSRLTGAGNIAINGPQLTSTIGTVTLANPFTNGAGASDHNGTIRVNTNAQLLNSPNKLANVGATGSALGAATIELNGGRLGLRDDGNATANATNLVLPSYGNKVNLTADSLIDANRANGTSSGNTIGLGTLTIPSGTKVLATDFSSNGTFTNIANAYQIGFDSIDGAGTLVKGGSQIINLNNYEPTFSGNITVAGPMGMTVAHSGGLVLNNATSNPLNDFKVNGVHTFTTGKSYVVGNVLEVGSNVGTVVNGLNGVTSGATTGYLAVQDTAFVSADTLRNNGQVGSMTGAATITANAIVGKGVYLTSGQALTLQGGLADDGASTTRLKVAGDNIVTLTAASSFNTGGAEVQSGVLKVAPSINATNPLGTGATPIRVLGVIATTAAGTTQPVAALSAELRFDSGTSTISQAGNITNSGLVHVTTGSTAISGTINGPGTTSYVPGLLEGRITGTANTGGGAADFTVTRGANPGNFGIRSEPRMGAQNLVTNNPITGWGDNETWIYNGQFFDADGKFTFAENIDDVAFVAIDGVIRMNNGASSQVTNTALAVGQTGTTSNGAAANTGTPTDTFGMGPNSDGWHNLEIRFRNGTGGAGPTVANGFFANYGFGLNVNGATALDGTQYLRAIDPGDGSLFRTPITDKGNVTIEGGATLSAAGITKTKALTFNSTITPALMNITGTAASDVDTVTVTGVAPQGRLNLTAGAVLTAGVLNVDATGTVHLNDNGGTGELKITAPMTGTGAVHVAAGQLTVTATANLNSTMRITTDSGGTVNATALASLVITNKTVVNNGTITGNVTSTGGATLSGSGNITGATTLTGGTVAPGNSPGKLSFGNGLTTNSTTFTFDLAGTTPATQYDQINVTGTLNFGAGNTSILMLNVTATPTLGDVYYLGLNDGVDAIQNTFSGLAEGGTFVDLNGLLYHATYQANWAGTQLGSTWTGGNDFALTVVPEPSGVLLVVLSLVGRGCRRRRA